MQNTCNPFTVTAAQVPEDTYIITENVDGIVERQDVLGHLCRSGRDDPTGSAKENFNCN